MQRILSAVQRGQRQGVRVAACLGVFGRPDQALYCFRGSPHCHLSADDEPEDSTLRILLTNSQPEPQAIVKKRINAWPSKQQQSCGYMKAQIFSPELLAIHHMTKSADRFQEPPRTCAQPCLMGARSEMKDSALQAVLPVPSLGLSSCTCQPSMAHYRRYQ